MRSLVKKAISRSVQNETLWSLTESTVLRLTNFIQWQRHLIEKSKDRAASDSATDAFIKSIFPDLTVKNGVFKGMRYPEAKSVGSTLFPKLLGSYEREIQPLLEKICRENYTEVINVGCAEGYYAVGLAMRVPTATVYAYDISDEAVNTCQKMAEFNNVAERVVLGSMCDAETLRSAALTKKRLIVCDCEGYEKELFSDEIIPLLAADDLLIEIHDFMDIEISSVIRRRFEKTHRIKTVESIDDIKKAQTYVYKELEAYDLNTRKDLLGEHRPSIMEWFFLTPLHS